MGKRYRNTHLVHGVVMDADLWVPEPGDEASIDSLIEEIASISKAVWQVPVWLVSRQESAKQASILQGLQRRWEKAEQESEKVIPMPTWVDGTQPGALERRWSG